MTRRQASRPYNVLFLCRGNSARSIMAECAMARWGRGKFEAFSAGSHPRGEVHPVTLAVLKRLDYAVDHLRSKDWAEFATPGSPPLDFVFTVCDRTAGEACPVWPGQPISAHWGVDDPAAVEGDAARVEKAFRDAYLVLEARIKLFAALPIRSLDRLSLMRRIDEIGAPGDSAA